MGIVLGLVGGAVLLWGVLYFARVGHERVSGLRTPAMRRPRVTCAQLRMCANLSYRTSAPRAGLRSPRYSCIAAGAALVLALAQRRAGRWANRRARDIDPRILM